MKREKFLPAFAILVITLFLALAAQAQVLTADQVPNAVKQTFQAKFPTVKLAEWKLKSDKNYEAEFTLKATEIAVKFDAVGKWLETLCGLLSYVHQAESFAARFSFFWDASVVGGRVARS